MPDEATACDGPRIVIIGGGFSGAALAMELMRGAYVFRSLHIIEATGEIGRGLAYGTETFHHLLNSRAVLMSVTDDRADFVNWLARRDQSEPAFPPRGVYGDYVAERFNDAHRRCGRYVHIVRGRAVSISEDLRAAQVTLDNGDRIAADIVVLAAGHQTPAAPPIVEAAGLSDDAFIGNPWKAGAHRGIRAEEDVLLLGTGMTAIDSILTLTQRDRRGRIYAISRRGLVPQAHAPRGRAGIARASAHRRPPPQPRPRRLTTMASHAISPDVCRALG